MYVCMHAFSDQLNNEHLDPVWSQITSTPKGGLRQRLPLDNRHDLEIFLDVTLPLGWTLALGTGK